MTPENQKLKLFVVGELSGDPREWNDLGNRTLVIATDVADALRLTDHSESYGLVQEVQMDNSCVIAHYDCGL